MQVGTIVAANYLAHAVVLARSLEAHHPGTTCTALLVDGGAGEARHLAEAGLHVVRAEDLPGVDRRRLDEMRTYYEVTELSTALKPVLLRHLLAADGVATYLDPDILLTAPLDELDAEARRAGIVLTPHVTSPIPRDGATIDEQVLLRAGTFNLGFIAVSGEAGPFLDWWWERLVTDALNDQPAGLFTDQRWIDLVPSLFRHTVLRDPGWNVGYWNLWERPLSRGPGGALLAGGAPLRFLHASGYDPRAPHLLSGHQGPHPRTLLSEHPVLAEVLDEYGRALEDAGHASCRDIPYGWAEVDGLPLVPFVRRAFRAAVLDGTAPPPPTVDRAAFLRWLHEPVAAGAGGLLTRVELAYWERRVDLHAHFPDPHGRSIGALTAWYRTGGDPDVAASLAPFLPPAPPPLALSAAPSHPGRPPAPGIVVAGYLRAESGVGDVARLALHAATRTGLPVEALDYGRTEARRSLPLDVGERGRHDPDVDLSVVVVNADQLHRFVADAGDLLPAGGRRAGLWSWELPELPPWLDRAFDLLDEVWASSTFTVDAIAVRAPCPVRLFPQPVVPDPRTGLDRADLGLPDDAFTFGFACDARSVLRRKNPVGLLHAYRDAFPADGRHHLLLKVVHGAIDPAGMEELRWAARGRSDVTVVDEAWTPAQAAALLQLVDCYASLHRSEGYGLGLAQAMAQGTPVVATGWSGNLSYMDDTDAHLVPSRLVTVGHAPPYPPDGTWAEPDHDAAVATLRAVSAERDAARATAAAAADRIRARFSVERAAAWLLDQAADASYDVARLAGEGAA